MLLYLDQDIDIENVDKIRSIIVHSDAYTLCLKDGIIVNDGINIYNVSYESIFKNDVPLHSQLNNIRLVIIFALFIFNIVFIFINFLKYQRLIFTIIVNIK